MPAVRAMGGEWGFSWRFGGLATLATFGNTNPALGTPAAGELRVTEIAVKRVFSQEWHVFFFAGTGLIMRKPDPGDTNADWAMSLGGGFEYHFRIWRRIAPLVGGQLALRVADPTGDNNWRVGVSFGPSLGIEYYIADRLSLTALYHFLLGFAFADSFFGFDFATQVENGGTLGITAYF